MSERIPPERFNPKKIDLQEKLGMKVDDELLKAYLEEGDQSAREDLFSRHYADILRYVSRHFGGRGDTKSVAEEITQTVFLCATRSLKTYRKEAPFKSWLYGIARNQIARRYNDRHFKASKRSKPIEDATDADLFNESIRLRDEHVEDVETETLLVNLHDAIITLKGIYREIIYMRFICDMDVKATAQVLGISESAVKTRCMRAKEQLEQKLKRINI